MTMPLCPQNVLDQPHTMWFSNLYKEQRCNCCGLLMSQILQPGAGPATPGRKLVAIEGIDAAGKATQSKMLARALDKAGGTDVLRPYARVFSFPHYSSSTGQLLRQHLTGEWNCVGSISTDGWQREAQEKREMLLRQALMTVNRYEQQSIIRYNLQHTHVILDRWWMSSLAYGVAEGLDRDWIVEVSRELLQPDLWVLIDIPPTLGAARRPPRDNNEKNTDKLEKVRGVYISEFTALSVGRSNRAVIINGDQSADDVHKEIMNAVSRIL